MSIRGAVLVVRGDAVLTESAGDPPGTRYQLASVSKQFRIAVLSNTDATSPDLLRDLLADVLG